MDKQVLQHFFGKQHLLTLATVDASGKQPWLANMYFVADEELNLYFVSAKETNHSLHIAENDKVAFTTAWYDPDNLGDRKAIQGKGKCELMKNWGEIAKVLKLFHAKYPDWKEVINLQTIKEKLIESRPYKITPSYIKYWDDELLGEEGTEELHF